MSDRRQFLVHPWAWMVFLAAGGRGALAAAAQDVKGSADHPLFPRRMPGYTISNYQAQAFAAYKFRSRPPQEVEGRYTRIHYYLQDPKAHPGGLAIRRNYEEAVKAVGGKVVHSDANVSVMQVQRDGAEVWVEVQAATNNTSSRIYFLHIVERGAMAQVIQADAMAAAIDKDGFVALDVHFATGKADILPESQPLLAETAKMLRQRPTLRVGVEGHTDDTGTPADNKQLSAARARAVADALVAAGIARERLEPVGHGQERPLADNRSEAGRAKNRRVEIVKR